MSKRHLKITKKLDLTEQQSNLLSATKPNKEQHQAMRDLRDQMRKLIESDHYSVAEAELLVDKISANKRQQILEKSQKMNAFYLSLSDEQRQKWTKLRDDKMQRKHRWLKRHAQRPGHTDFDTHS